MRKTIIIAEAGVNHNGSIEFAKKLIDVAAEAGADYVKFQTFNSQKLVTDKARKASYQMNHSDDKSDSQIEMLEKLELSKESHFTLIDHCRLRGIGFLSTAFDNESIYFLKSLNLGLWKIPSGEITNYPYLKLIAAMKEPVILSTGMSEMQEISAAIEVLMSEGLSKEDITILHCNTDYPTPYEDVHLNAMNYMGELLNVNVGYSDHTLGIEIPIAAVALGATVIEKHFTLDREMGGPDHRASLEPHELRKMVHAIRIIETALGNKKKTVTPSEKKNMLVVRKSIVAANDIKKGTLFTEENLTTKRPAGGLSPMQWTSVIGKKAMRDFDKDEFIVIDYA